MNYAYRFGDPQTLYLNVTNRCTSRCWFCVRNRTEGLGGAVLWGTEEPDLPALQHAIESNGGIGEFREFVWCGFGEPTFRLDLISQAAGWLRSCGAEVRLNTNGHACLIHGRDVLPELSESVDAVSISLNAPDMEKYLKLCQPGFADLAVPPEKYWSALLDFMARAPKCFKETQASVVGCTLSDDEVERCRNLVYSLDIQNFRIR
jgi:TatD family-associated radical SAM protein